MHPERNKEAPATPADAFVIVVSQFSLDIAITSVRECEKRMQAGSDPRGISRLRVAAAEGGGADHVRQPATGSPGAVHHAEVLLTLFAGFDGRESCGRLDQTQPAATPAQPATGLDQREEMVSGLKSVVSRVGIVPERRGRMPKPERLKTTPINDPSSSEGS